MGGPQVITEAKGNLLDADVDALVNTVNTVGVMGKGIALQFRRAYPAMFDEYSRAVKRGELQIGRMHVWETGLLAGPRFVINFPTKRHWRGGSQVEWIDAGLHDLVKTVERHQIRSIALPPLGCGNGGLEWTDVKPLIRDVLGALPDVDVLVFSPGHAISATQMASTGKLPRMTPGRAALVAIMRAYAERALAWPSLIETQKLMYFLQLAGEPLRLRYQKHLYGPYADNLRHVLRELEGHYIVGFGDGSALVHQAEPLQVLPAAEPAAQPILDAHPETAHRVNRVMDLADGFESAYGMELLASVHWIAHESPELADDPKRLAQVVSSWTPRKGRLFTQEHVEAAWRALRDRGWLGERVPVSTGH